VNNSPTGTVVYAGTQVVAKLNGNTITTGTGVLTLAAGKTLTASNTLTLAGTDATTHTFPATSATIARTDAGQTFSGTQAFAAISYSTTLTGGTGVVALGTNQFYKDAAGNVGIGTATPSLVGVNFQEFTIWPLTADRCGIMNLVGTRDFGGNQNGIVNFWNAAGTNTAVAKIQCINGAASAVEGSLFFATKLAAGTLTDQVEVTAAGDLKMLNVGKGLTVTSPDGLVTKTITISNAGVLTLV
jgi:hypothetical protein